MLLETRIISFQYTTRIDLQTDPVDDQKKTFDLPNSIQEGKKVRVILATIWVEKFPVVRSFLLGFDLKLNCRSFLVGGWGVYEGSVVFSGVRWGGGGYFIFQHS